MRRTRVVRRALSDPAGFASVVMRAALRWFRRFAALLAASLAASVSEAAVVDDTAEVDEDQSIVVNVEANDSGGSGGANVFQVFDLDPPNAATLTLQADDQIKVSPAQDFNGDLTFRYRRVLIPPPETARVTVTVRPVNDKPVVARAIADLTVVEDSGVNNLDLRSVFEDVDGDRLRLSIAGNTNPALFGTISFSGTVGLIDNYLLSLKPAGNAFGIAELTVRATDTSGEFAETTFKYSVTDQDDRPQVANDTVSINEDSISDLAADVLSNDVSVDTGDFRFVEARTSAGTVDISVPTKLVFTPAANANGDGYATIEYRVADGAGSDTLANGDVSDLATVTVNGRKR